MTEIATIDWFGRWGTSVFSENTAIFFDCFLLLSYRTKETLASGHFMSVINILMQLRKVCNHPSLFDPRPIVSPFQMEGLVYNTASMVLNALKYDPLEVGVICCDLKKKKLKPYAAVMVWNRHRHLGCLIGQNDMSHDMRKPIFAICEQERHRSACASVQSDSTFTVHCLDC